jgi:DNA-binding NtrC family response regulator
MGDHRERSVDVRLIAATHHDLLDAVGRRAFRQDLYYRISTVTITVPPLRERREEILPIAAEMLAGFGGGAAVALSRCAADRLLEHPWPGNLRELKNVLERALLRRRGETIDAGDIRFDGDARTSRPRWLAADAVAATRDDVEKEHIRLALAAENGQVKAAARRLGMSRTTLYSKLKAYRIDRPRGRAAGGEAPPAPA